MKKAQAAMEFLMTYGWAILIVLVAIASIAYFGVLSPETFLPEKCVISTGSGLFCEQFSVSLGEVKLRIRNTLTDEIEVTKASISKEGNSCNLNPPIIIPADGFVDLILNVGPTCANLTALGRKLKGEISITYTKRSFLKTTTGSLVSKITKTIALPPPQDYVSYWKFDEQIDMGTYNMTPDETEINNGTLIGNAVIISDAIGGNVLNLDGMADYINITDSPSLDITEEITLSVWINLDSYSPDTNDAYRWPKVITKPHTSYASPWELYSLGFDHYGEYIMFLISDGSSQAHAGDSSHKLALKQWYHIAGTYNSSLISLYINATLIDTTSSNWVLGTNNMPVSIGSRYTPSGGTGNVGSSMNWFNGTIDEVMIFNRSLSAAEIQQIYCGQEGSAAFC